MVTPVPAQARVHPEIGDGRQGSGALPHSGDARKAPRKLTKAKSQVLPTISGNAYLAANPSDRVISLGKTLHASTKQRFANAVDFDSRKVESTYDSLKR
eukprot:4632676-Prymnesium_polylepis.1